MKNYREPHIHLYLSGRVIPGLVGTIMGLEGGLIMGGPGIMGMCPPIGGLIPGARGREREGVREELWEQRPSHSDTVRRFSPTLQGISIFQARRLWAGSFTALKTMSNW